MGFSNNDQTMQHQSLGETLASSNVFYQDGTNQPKSSNDHDNKTVFADEKKNVKAEAAAKLNKMEQPMDETLKELNSATPVGLARSSASDKTPKLGEAAKKDAFVDSKALHNEKAATLLHSHKPMKETLGEANKYVGGTKESA